MKIIFDIKQDRVIKTFIDDNKVEYSENWVEDTVGYKSIGQTIGTQLERDGYDDEFIEAIDDLDAFDVWRSDYVQEC